VKGIDQPLLWKLLRVTIGSLAGLILLLTLLVLLQASGHADTSAAAEPEIVLTDARLAETLTSGRSNDTAGPTSKEPFGPSRSPDGTQIAYTTLHGSEISIINPEGAGGVERSTLGSQSPYLVIEEFDSAVSFTSTHPQDVYVDEANSRAVLNVTRSETRLLSRPIPDLTSGDFRVTVRGQFNAANNNCPVRVYLTDGLPEWRHVPPGALVSFGFSGGGCSNQFDHISAGWSYPDGQGYYTHHGYVCGGSNGTIIPISRGVPYTAELELLSSQGTGTLSVYDDSGHLVGSLTGPAGFQADFGTLNTLSLGYNGDGDWPSCNGYIDSVRIEGITDTSPLNSLVAYYPFNGNANDESENGNHGVVHGPILTTDRDGNDESAYSFDGTDDYLEIPANSVLADMLMGTIAFWFKPSSDWEASSPVQGLISNDKGGYNNDFQIGFNAVDNDNNNANTGKIYFHLQGSGRLLALGTTTTSWRSDHWYFLTFTWNGVEAKVFVNGILEGTLPFSSKVFDSDVSTDIGVTAKAFGPLPTKYFSGKIDDVRIYNRALTEEAIQALYTSGGPDTTPPAPVNDLSAQTGTTLGSVDLRWTAPGDDGDVGTATSYIVRYNTVEITDANWDASTDVDGEPAPSVAGTSESMTVTGLTPGETYYFAIKTQDEVPNTSALSNVAGPVRAYDPDLELARKYAPFLWLHKDEIYGPNPISVMLYGAAIRRHTAGVKDPNKDEVIEPPPVTVDDLVNKTTEDHYLDLWYARYKEADKYRERFTWLYGVYGGKEGVKAYARVCRSNTKTVIQYWFFYYYNDFADKHEGDWEMVQVVLKANGTNLVPTHAAYSEHVGGARRRWKDVEKEKDNNTHPVVYVGKGSHASFFAPGRHRVDLGLPGKGPFLDVSGKGTGISLGEYKVLELLRSPCGTSPPEQPSPPKWLMFPGHWGEYFDGCERVINLPQHVGAACGPKGPSQQGDKWTNPIDFGAANTTAVSAAEQAFSWFDSLPWDELADHYTAQTRVILADCQSHVLSLTDAEGRRLSFDVNEIDPNGRLAEYIRNCDPGGAGRQTILIHAPNVQVSRIDLLPAPTALIATDIASIQQTQAITLEVNLPDYANNLVTQATYTDVTVSITTTGSISVTAGGDLPLDLDNDGDGTPDQTVTPTLEETEQDFTAPAAVSDLAVTEVIIGAVTVSWTAPGDDGLTGTASLYELGYYTEPITASNWVSATQIVSPTVPTAAGTTQTAMVNDLPSGTFYFAVRAVDEVGNVGDISNIPSATVIGYPEGDFDHSCLVDVLDVSDVATRWRLCVGDDGYSLDYDLNKDACINIVDIVRVSKQWGSGCE